MNSNNSTIGVFAIEIGRISTLVVVNTVDYSTYLNNINIIYDTLEKYKDHELDGTAGWYNSDKHIEVSKITSSLINLQICM